MRWRRQELDMLLDAVFSAMQITPHGTTRYRRFEAVFRALADAALKEEPFTIYIDIAPEKKYERAR